MGKIELKYISPYLPYGLMLTNLEQPMNGRMCELLCNQHYDTIKPILRPMSDFWDTSQSWMQQVRDIDNSIEFWSGEFDNPCHLPYVCFELLLENHFDVFGLIGQNLAVDINTLKEETT